MKTLLALWLILTFGSIYAQNNSNSWHKIDNLARKTSFIHLDSLSNYIQHVAKNEEDKIRFIFIWITENIAYDVSKISSKEYDTQSQNPLNVFRSRKAICTGYANILQELCKKTGIQAYVVEGNAFQNKIAGHAWNVARIDNTWKLMDATWAAGVIENGRFRRKFDDSYFFTNPKDFVVSHLPLDPMWQLLTEPVSKLDFVSRKISKLTDKSDFFAYQDTLNHFLKLDAESQALDSYSRALRFSPDDTVMQDTWQRKYYTQGVFTASDLYDEATENLRLYFDTKYKAFGNLKYLNDNENSVREWLEKAHHCLDSALTISSKIILLKAAKANFSLLQENQENMITNLAYIQEETGFVEKYYATSLATRHLVLQKFPRVLTF
jgi:hypothetical protein